MSPLGRMVFPRAPPLGKPSSLGETFHHVTPTGMAYLYNVFMCTVPYPLIIIEPCCYYTRYWSQHYVHVPFDTLLNCTGPALTAVWSKAPPRCLSPLHGFESQPGHVGKLPVTWGQAVVFAGYSGFLHYLQLASHELAIIGINVTKNNIPCTHSDRAASLAKPSRYEPSQCWGY